MEFKKINEGINCNCIENAKEDIENNYALKTNKENLREQDFVTYHEKNKVPLTDKCDEICSLRGLSISIFNDTTKDKVVDIYRELFKLAPKYKPYIYVISFTENLGLVKHTPNDMNEFHYDFYKCDTFDFGKVNIHNSTELHYV